VILFDEIEKAHGDVFNLLLQVLDDGRLTDGQGRTVDFRNAIVIMTSNIGSARILDFRGSTDSYDFERMREAVLVEMRQQFRPEFLNRVDEMVVFHSLRKEDLQRIVHIQLGRLRERLEERKLTLELSSDAVGYLGHAGFDPTYGARPLKRAIQRELETPLARLLLSGAIRDGGTVYVDIAPDGGPLRFQSERPADWEASRRSATHIN
jgi:ATP-dependent Clp protease ATP-binding subunit ClpB